VEELAGFGRRTSVVDLGCGSGIVARALVVAGHDVTGVDFSSAMLAIAMQSAPRARFVEGSLYDVAAWTREPVDAVLAIGEPLSYLEPRGRTPELAPFFRNVAHALRPGGIFVFDIIVAGAPALTRRMFVEGDGWAVLTDTRDDGARLTRDMTTFTRAGVSTQRRPKKDVWTRGHERHVVRVADVDAVRRDLARAGFTVRVRRAYGDHVLAVRRRAFICRRR
jgi:SAM-dependent methyltransferase